MILKLKLQYFGHLMQRVDSLEKPSMLRNIEGRRRRRQQRMRWLDSITNSPRWGRSPQGGHGNPLQYSGLENSLECIVHGVARIRWPKYWSFSFSISPSNEYSGLISFKIDWFDLLAIQGTLKNLLQHHSSKASILHHSASFIVQLSAGNVGNPLQTKHGNRPSCRDQEG